MPDPQRRAKPARVLSNGRSWTLEVRAPEIAAIERVVRDPFKEPPSRTRHRKGLRLEQRQLFRTAKEEVLHILIRRKRQEWNYLILQPLLASASSQGYDKIMRYLSC
jgi:hypothetical protein